MSYEPTNWKDGDLVTSAKLNKIEQGIANGTLVVHLTWENDEVAIMDKTWQQIYDADSVVVIDRREEQGGEDLILERYFVSGTYYGMNEYSVIANLEGDSPMRFLAETANSYPIYNTGK